MSAAERDPQLLLEEVVECASKISVLSDFTDKLSWGQVVQSGINAAVFNCANAMVYAATRVEGCTSLGNEYVEGVIALAQVNQNAVIASGAFTPLVHMLQEGTADVRKNTILAIANLTCSSGPPTAGISNVLVSALPPLVQLLSDVKLKDCVALAICNISCSDHSMAAVAVDLLVQLSGVPETKEAAAIIIADIICHIVTTEYKQHRLIHHTVVVGALIPLVWLLKAEANAKMLAVRAIANIANSEEHRDAVVAAGALSPLVQLLSDDATKTRQYAAGTVATICATSVARKNAAIAAGAVSPLVVLLGDDAAEVKQQAARAVANIASGVEAHVAALVSACAVDALVHLLSDGAAEVQKYAASSIKCIAYDHRDAVIAAGALKPLVQLLADGSTADVIQKQAIMTLVNIASAGISGAASVIAAGALPPLVQLLTGGLCRLQEQAVRAVLCMTYDHRVAVVAAEAVCPLVKLLNVDIGRTKEHAVRAIANIAINEEHRDAVVAAGALSPLVQLLSDDATKTRQYAAGTVATICATSVARKNAAIAAGAVSPLVVLLGDDAAEVKQQAARAVANIASGVEAHVAALVSACAVDALVHLLSDGAAEVQKYAASSIKCIAYDHRDAVIAAGALKPLVQLLADGSTADVIQKHGAAHIIQKQAIIAIVHLCTGSRAHVASVVAANALRPLVELLSAGTSRLKEHAATALNHMAVNNRDAVSAALKHIPANHRALIATESGGGAMKKQTKLGNGRIHGRGLMSPQVHTPLQKLDENDSVQLFDNSVTSFDSIRPFDGKGPTTRTNRIIRDRILEENDPILSFESTQRDSKRILFQIR